MTSCPFRTVLTLGALVLLLPVALTATPPPGPEDSASPAGGRVLSAEERRLLAEAGKLHEETLELWRESPEEALTRAEKALEIRGRVLGTDHPDYATSLDSAARIYKILGEHARAKGLFEQALSVRRRALGEDHPDYRASLKSLAGLYYLVGDYELARSFYDEAEKIERRLAILADIGRPAAWMAVRSYAAVEEALGDLWTRAGGAATAGGLRARLQRVVGGLEGIDRTRPIGVSLPVLGGTRMLGIVVSIPYSDPEAILGTARRFFPVMNEQDGVLRFEGGPVPAFGRVDEEVSLLLLSTIAELLPSPHGRVPTDLFTAASDPSVVVHVDLDAALSLRNSPLKDLEERLLERLQGFGVALSGGDSHYEKVFREVVSGTARHLVDGLLGDLSTAELRLWAADDWKLDVRVRARPGSATAGFLAAQDARRLRLQTPAAPDRLGGVRVGLRLHEGLRTAARGWWMSLREWAASNPPPMEDSTAATHEARVEVAPKLLSICERLTAEETIEAGWELTSSGGEPVPVFWLRGARCGGDVLELVEFAHLGSTAPRGGAGLVPSFDRHGSTLIHLVRADGLDERRTYIAAEDHFLLICRGAAVEPLKTTLDLTREQGPLPPGGPRRALFELELSIAGLARAGSTLAEGKAAPLAAVFRERLLRGADAAFATAVRATEDGLALDARCPEPVLAALAAVLRASLTPETEAKTGVSEGE